MLKNATLREPAPTIEGQIMKHIVSITPTPLDISEGLPNGGTHWQLQCESLPEWYISLPRESVLRLSYIDHICRAVRLLDGVSMVSSVSGGEEDVLILSFVTTPSDELSRTVVEAIDKILSEKLYGLDAPVIGNGNDI